MDSQARVSGDATDAWRAAEDRTLDLLSVERADGSGSISEARSGRFAALVACALGEDLLSLDTAAAWLGVRAVALDSGWRAWMTDLFPHISAEVERSRARILAHARRARFDADRCALASVVAAHPDRWIALASGVTIAHDPSYRALLAHTRRLGYDPAALLYVNPAQRFVPV